MALKMLKRAVKKRAGFNIETVAPLDHVGECFVPALFGHAGDDSFVGKHHSERLFQAYAGDKVSGCRGGWVGSGGTAAEPEGVGVLGGRAGQAAPSPAHSLLRPFFLFSTSN